MGWEVHRNVHVLLVNTNLHLTSVLFVLLLISLEMVVWSQHFVKYLALEVQMKMSQTLYRYVESLALMWIF